MTNFYNEVTSWQLEEQFKNLFTSFLAISIINFLADNHYFRMIKICFFFINKPVDKDR